MWTTHKIVDTNQVAEVISCTFLSERAYSIADVSGRLGISAKIFYLWLREGKGKHQDVSQVEVARLKAELKRVEEERDILKKAAAYSARESQ